LHIEAWKNPNSQSQSWTHSSSGNKSKNWQAGLHQIKKILHIKGNNDKNEETAYRMGKKSLSSILLTWD
jgi:hypothetical protein